MNKNLRKDDNGRECSACSEYKPWTEYNKGDTQGHRTECRDCQKKLARQYKRDKTKQAVNIKRYREKKRLGK